MRIGAGRRVSSVPELRNAALSSAVPRCRVIFFFSRFPPRGGINFFTDRARVKEERPFDGNCRDFCELRLAVKCRYLSSRASRCNATQTDLQRTDRPGKRCTRPLTRSLRHQSQHNLLSIFIKSKRKFRDIAMPSMIHVAEEWERQRPFTPPNIRAVSPFSERTPLEKSTSDLHIRPSRR